jgi:anhydro-N-acetylmuramic acid kinase
VSAAARPLYLGLISGTSADGVDAALCQFDPQPRLLAGGTFPYPEDTRDTIIRLAQTETTTTLDELGALDHAVGEHFAAAASALLENTGTQASQIAAIGSHGQTLCHRPRAARPFTWQIGDPSLIAERSGCTVVADFRRRDVAAGGEGAPLLPALHAALLRDPAEARAVLNLGGIANLTLLPGQDAVRGFDSGPANCLLDAWHARHRGMPIDQGGAWAASASPDPELLGELLADPWFRLPPPKSTGREVLNLAWLAQRGAARVAALSPAQVQATLLALTVETVAGALEQTQPSTRRLLVCGGGVHNPTLMAALGRRLPDMLLQSTAALGVDPDLVEAMGFAWLAHATLAGRPGNLPEVTGAGGPRILGGIYHA